VLTQSDGLLVLRPESWSPRRRPWLLPAEVAGALGRFFAAGTEHQDDALGPVHGDFAPWNLLQTDRGWVLVDWEEAHHRGRPFVDLFHYLVMAHVNLEVPSQQSLLAGLEGNGWIGRAIAAYAEGAQLLNEDLRELLIFYLHSSSQGLNIASSGGLADFRSRQRLLESLEG
jgi:aminoglycoside phosphotransferase (APT) family kinase protein